MLIKQLLEPGEFCFALAQLLMLNVACNLARCK